MGGGCLLEHGPLLEILRYVNCIFDCLISFVS